MSKLNRNINIKIKVDDKEIEAKLLNADEVLRQIHAQSDSVGKSLSEWGNIVTGVNQGLEMAGRAWDKVSKPVDISGMFETYDVQFEVLLGSMDEAEERIDELSEFAAKTPFEFEEIIRASKQLEVMTKGAISTGDGLKLLGDVSAGVGEDVDELSMWFGRLYDAIQSGRPIGEAMMRLQELGAISGEDRSKIEALQAAGADANETWEVFTDSMSRFNGMMKKQSETYEGLVSNLEDATTLMLKSWGDELLPVAKEAVEVLTQFAGLLTITPSHLDKANKKIREERNEFELLVVQYERMTKKTNLNNIEKERLSTIISELNSKYGEYLGNIDLERDSWEKVATAISKAREELIKHAKAMAIQAMQKDYLDDMIAIETQIQKNEQLIDEFKVQIGDIREDQGRPRDVAIPDESEDTAMRAPYLGINYLKERNTILRKEINRIAEESAKFGEKWADLLNIDLNPDEDNSSTGGGGKSSTTSFSNQIKTAEELKAKLEELNILKDTSLTQDEKELKILEIKKDSQISALDAEIASLQKKDKLSAEEKQKLENLNTQKLIIQEKYNQDVSKLTEDQQQEALTKQHEFNQKELEALGASNLKKLEEQREYLSAMLLSETDPEKQAELQQKLDLLDIQINEKKKDRANEIEQIKIGAMADGLKKQEAELDQWYSEQKETEYYKTNADVKLAIDQEYSRKSNEILKEKLRQSKLIYNSIQAGYNEMWQNFMIGNRKAKNEWDAVWLSMRSVALNALADILWQELENIAVSVAAHIGGEQAKTAATEEGVALRLISVVEEIGKTLASAAASMVNAVASLIEWQVATFGPFALATIPGSVAAMMGIFNATKKAMGFQHGGRLRKGEDGFFEGYENEIIAPEKTFLEVFRSELRPQIYSGMAASNNSDLVMEIQGLRQDLQSGGIKALAYYDDRETKKIYSKGRYLNGRGRV